MPTFDAKQVFLDLLRFPAVPSPNTSHGCLAPQHVLRLSRLQIRVAAVPSLLPRVTHCTEQRLPLVSASSSGVAKCSPLCANAVILLRLAWFFNWPTTTPEGTGRKKGAQERIRDNVRASWRVPGGEDSRRMALRPSFPADRNIHGPL